MEFHGVGKEDHCAHVHKVTSCIHDHPHHKMEAASKAGAGAARAQSQQVSQTQGEGQLSLSAWLDNYLSRGKNLLRSIWGSSEVSPAGEVGEQSGREQVLAQISDSRETNSQGTIAAGQESRQADSAQTIHAAKAAGAAAAVEPPRTREGYGSVSVQEEGGGENLWRKVKVRFKDIAGQLTGHLKGNAFQAGTKSALPEKKVPVREPRKPVRVRKDAVEIDSHRVEESYLLDSYDRKGGYSKISTKK